VTIENPGIGWQPGQHVFLTCHSIVPLQCHPFTIASIPEDNRMEFFIRAENGGTRRFFRFASKNDSVLGSGEVAPRGRTIFVEGPYGSMRPLRQFDSVVLLAGGMGATFTMPLLRDVVTAWKQESTGQASSRTARLAATKRLRFIWVIKSSAQLSYFETQLQSLLADVQKCRRTQPNFEKELEVSIYITCDEKLDPPTTASETPSSPAQAFTQEVSTFDEKKGSGADHVSIHSVSSQSTSNQKAKPTGKGCLPGGGGCCCTTQIEDEDEITNCACTCAGPAPVQLEKESSDAKTDAQSLTSDDSSFIHPTIVSGRPTPRTIIRKVLEKAEGESAVVVCGPRGLADDVRRSVVSLSDERAVHKGTGAQGIYLHVENFGL
jgi:NAD(P)H-flavin reductase